jgi:hypothetical protein
VRADKPSTIQTVHQQTAALGLSLIPSDFIADPSSACYTIRRLAEEYREDMYATSWMEVAYMKNWKFASMTEDVLKVEQV